MDLIRLWIQVMVIWGLSGFVVFLVPDGSRSVPSFWGYVNLETLFAVGLVLLAGRQVVKVSAKSLSYFLYLPLPVKSLVRWRSLFPLAAAWGAVPFSHSVHSGGRMGHPLVFCGQGSDDLEGKTEDVAGFLPSDPLT